MVPYKVTIQRFNGQGEKTGWTYVIIPAAIAQQLIPGNKKAFRVKGYLDDYKFEALALMPVGGGDFMMPLNASVRKSIRKSKGAIVQIKLEVDKKELQPPAELIECLKDEPAAFKYYHSLSQGNKNYFTKWIESAKTDETKTKRIAQAITALSRQYDFGAMLRALK